MSDDKVNFKLKEGMYPLFDEIRDDFTREYLDGSIHWKELKEKYGLSHSEFKELADEVKKEYGLNRKPTKDWGKNYYPYEDGFVVKKRINDVLYHIAFVYTEEEAKEIVELCKGVRWDVLECRRLVKKYKEEHGYGQE